MSSAQASLNKTTKMFSGQLANKGRQVQRMRTGMAKLAPTVAPKLFANLTKDMNSAQKYQRIMRNFINLSQEERKVTLSAMKTHLENTRARAARATQIAKENSELKEWAAVQIEDAQRLENTYEQMMILDRDRANEKRKLAAEEKKLLKEQKEARENLNTALEQEEKLTQDLVAAQEKLHAAMNKAVQTVKQAFGEVLRDSISILTGFYYKLNEATEGLKDFEKELLNANSVFGLTRDELFSTSQAIVQFGQEFGLAMDNGASGLYQLASAGLSADEAIAVLPHTLKLSMAVQGDHNTISKLTAQTIFGFGLEMDQAAEVTDKFAHSIQKSLIEYQDLGSAVKFALPFFTATGQSIDQLLGSLEVLTNRALEAGIAGRGLRQALAEFAESAEDNTTAFRKMGIEILNSEGEMLQLTEIAKLFADAIGPDVASNTKLLSALIQDLNVRGATAFIHLVQNAEEFEAAVEGVANAGGELDEMVRIQNESINAQIQILKNNVQAIFFMRDANADGTDSLNEFHQGVLDVIASLRGLIVEELADGTYALTRFGRDIRDIATKAVKMFGTAVQEIVHIIKDFTDAGFLNLSMLKAYFFPISAVLKVIQLLGPNVIKMVVWWKILNAVIPISTLLTLADEIAIIANTTAKVQNVAATTAASAAEMGRAEATAASTAATLTQTSVLGKLGKGITGLGRLLLNPYVLAAAVLATLTYLVLRTMDLKSAFAGLVLGASEMFRMLKFAISPLTELFDEWGRAVERAFGHMGGDNRAAVMEMMMEISAVVAIIVFGVSHVIAAIFRLIVDIGTKVIAPLLSQDLWRLITVVEYLMGRPAAIRDIPSRAVGTLTGGTMGGTGYNMPGLGDSQGSKNVTTVASWTAAGAGMGATYGMLGGGPGMAVGALVGGGVGLVLGTGIMGVGELDRRWAQYKGKATGGMIPAYANGGPILVGENGPELFIPPRMGGQVLNTDRTRNLLRGQQNGVAAGGNGMVNTLIVSQILSQNTVSQNSRIAVDTFAGVV